MDSRKIPHFFNNVLIRLGIYDWELIIKDNSTEGYCWNYNKTIVIGWKAKEPFSLILHEIAHINTCRFCNNKHNLVFWKTYRDLLRRFLPNYKISESELKWEKSTQDIGYHRRTYEKT